MTAMLQELPSAQGWQARMTMRVACRSPHGRSTVVALQHEGPLRIQRPFYPEGNGCHIYLLHPPGGVVGGDAIDLQVSIERGAQALFTAPGATKFYRSAGDVATVQQRFTVAEGGLLEWLPHEMILFPGARVRAATRFTLQGDAQLCAWDIVSLGRPACNEAFMQGDVANRIEVVRDDRLLLVENLRVLSPAHLGAAAGLRNYPMQATLIISGANTALLDAARAILDAVPCSRVMQGATLIEDLLVVRALGYDTESLQQALIPVWQMARETVHGKGRAIPRIWAT